MESLFKDLFGIFKFFEDVYIGIQKLLMPPKAFSWQTLIYLSVFSWGLSLFATDFIRNAIAFCGWLFLIAGTAWYTTDGPVRIPGTFMPLGALISGFLISVFAFGHQEYVVTPRTIVLWPTIAALITAIPEFFEGTGTEAKTQIPKPEVRQKIIILVASCMLISCWIQFYFVTDTWLRQYPSLLADQGNFKQSNFVIRIEEPNKKPQNGTMLLNKIQPLIEEQIIEKPWSEVEKWLLTAKGQVEKLSQAEIEKNLTKYQEQKLWRVEPRIVNTQTGYQLDILSIWTGPSSNPRGYYLKKSCRIEPIAASRPSGNKNTFAEIECDSNSKLILGAPPPQQ